MTTTDGRRWAKNDHLGPLAGVLAIARALLAAAAAFAPAPANLPLAVVAAVVLVVGIIAGIAHTGAFYLPALVVLAVGVARIWRERG